MGNTKVKERLRRQSSDRFLGTDEFKGRISQFYSDELEGSAYEKYTFVYNLI